MNRTTEEQHLDPRDKEPMWCTEHQCESSDCPVDEVVCELITMSMKAREERDDWSYDWNEEQ